MSKGFRLTRNVRWATAIALCLLGASTAAQAPPDIETVLARVGARIADYYKRAQNVVCIEKTMVQPVDYDYSPRGFARVTEYELHVEADENGDEGEAKVVRELVRINGRPPREKDKKDRAGCTDANPLSTEPLAFLLPSHRAEYTFASGGFGKGKDRNTLIVEFTSGKPEGKGEIAEDPRGHDDCFTWSLPVALKGKVWIDADSYQVVRVEQRMAGMADLSVSSKLQRKHNLESSVVVERHDTTIRYKT
ncbi:MAG: hypothetical protein ACRD2I_24675, partial [Vicinamibacterales bacterium]